MSQIGGFRIPHSTFRIPHSEGEPEAETHLSFRIERRAVVVGDSRDLSERCGRYVVGRIGKDAAVEDVADFDAGLEALAPDREDPEHRQIEVAAAGAGELVAARAA